MNGPRKEWLEEDGFFWPVPVVLFFSSKVLDVFAYFLLPQFFDVF